MIVVIKSGGFNLSSAKPTCIARESTPWHDQLIIFGSPRSAKIEFDAFFVHGAKLVVASQPLSFKLCVYTLNNNLVLSTISIWLNLDGTCNSA